MPGGDLLVNVVRKNESAKDARTCSTLHAAALERSAFCICSVNFLPSKLLLDCIFLPDCMHHQQQQTP